MRPTHIARSGNEHLWWGSPQVHQQGFYEYGVSPFHIKSFKGWMNPGLGKWAKTMGKHAMFIVPPMLFYLGLQDWAIKKYEYYNRKEYLNSVGGSSGH
ncbi:hypothetical protein BJ742DRAFT_337454 [Cladochytrium replicatum]|nr:hypothetical protein BJ742DRAFT_337454 [Cladochytrium replicatum]